MGIREQLNKYSKATVVVVAVLFGIAIWLMISNNRDVSRQRVSSAYYSTDDGKTHFADDVDQIYPFKHDGKDAYRAYVYQCGSQPPFVSYLARYDVNAHQKLEKLKGNKSPAAVEEFNDLSSRIEVKKPGAGKWVPILSGEGQTITSHPICPDGSTARSLFP